MAGGRQALAEPGRAYGPWLVGHDVETASCCAGRQFTRHVWYATVRNVAKLGGVCAQDVTDLTSGIANGYIVGQVFYDIFVVRARTPGTRASCSWTSAHHACCCCMRRARCMHARMHAQLLAAWAPCTAQAAAEAQHAANVHMHAQLPAAWAPCTAYFVCCHWYGAYPGSSEHCLQVGCTC
jgi:hypothetical protein